MKYKLFSAAFLLLCLFPLVGILFFGVAEPAANEILAFWPSLTEEDGSFNLSYLDEVEDYLADRFALRQEMVTLQHSLTSHLFGETGVDDVIQGKDGWLFYGDTLADYEGTSFMTEREIWSAARSLYLMQEYCTEQGATFLFTIAPNKNSLYGEYMPDRYPASTAESNADRLADALAEQSVAYTDLFAVFLAQEDILYRKLDSHWNQRGAALAGDTLLAALGMDFTPFFPEEYETVWEEIGDLYEMVYPTGTETDEDQQYLRAFTFTYTDTLRTTSQNLIRTANENASGSLLMFRDSFGNTLHTFMAEAFGTACFSRSMPYDLTMLATEEADTVVIELVERNLSWLNTRPAIFPAPIRQLDGGDGISIRGSISLSVSESSSLPGYLCISGDLTGYNLSSDSPIYILAEGTVYEATPAGDGEVPFTAYLPEEAVQGQLYVLYQWEGTLCGCQCTLPA